MMTTRCYGQKPHVSADLDQFSQPPQTPPNRLSVGSCANLTVSVLDRAAPESATDRSATNTFRSKMPSICVELATLHLQPSLTKGIDQDNTYLDQLKFARAQPGLNALRRGGALEVPDDMYWLVGGRDQSLRYQPSLTCGLTRRVELPRRPQGPAGEAHIWPLHPVPGEHLHWLAAY